MSRNDNGNAVDVVVNFQNIGIDSMSVNFTAFGTDGKYFPLVSSGNDIVEYGIAYFFLVLRSADDSDASGLKRYLISYPLVLSTVVSCSHNYKILSDFN